jgi:hypothetical protein
MLPNQWTWSPRVQFPFSGSVAQDISPDTSWFFGAIRPGAGVGSIEQDVFEVASYGKQLGLILDVLLPMIGEGSPNSAASKEAREKLKDLYRRVEAVKAQRKEALESAAVELLAKIERTDPDMLERVVKRFKA